MQWIKVEDQLPPHMKEIKVWIERPNHPGYERKESAVFLMFDGGGFYDVEEQITLHNVTKWKRV